jgi:hypothetical protein
MQLTTPEIRPLEKYTPRRRLLLMQDRWLLLALLISGALLRLYVISDSPLWVDEAETCINAFTIMQHGVPVSEYLGLPIYENTLTQPWPEHPEYEFRDSSYSSAGYALYHGWLPMYLIAASFRTFGIQPDRRVPAATTHHDYGERRWRTVVARLPSVLIGMLAIAAAAMCAREMFGRQAGICAAVICCFSSFHIGISAQARYYVATVALNLVCGTLIWRLGRSGRIRDYGLAALASAALFHTHLLSFLVMSVMFGVTVPFLFRADPARTVRGLTVFGGVTSVLVVPWLLWTGFVGHVTSIPMAWRLLSFPRDFIIGPVVVNEYTVAGVAAAVCVVAALFPGESPTLNRIRRSLPDRQPFALAFLIAWMLVGYCAFVFGMPAASFWIKRMAVSLIAPATVLTAGLIATLASMLSTRSTTAVAFCVAAMFAVLSTRAHPLPSEAMTADAWRDVDRAMEYLDRQTLTADTRIYASPNEHLSLMFYSGVPVQSIAPVRKRFFDSWPGPVIYFEKTEIVPAPEAPAGLTGLAQALATDGISLTPTELQEMSWNLLFWNTGKQLEGKVRHIEPAVQLTPAAVRIARKHQADLLRRQASRTQIFNPMFRGFTLMTVHDWWNIFFYRFVDPEQRRNNPIWRERLISGTATILKANWVVYTSPLPVL